MSSLELNTLLICRCCACPKQKPSDFIDIFKEQRFGERIVDILLKYLPFQVNETDTESHFICTKCWTTFEHFHSFIEYIQSCQIQMVHIKCEITNEFSMEHIKPECNTDGSVKSDFDNTAVDDIDGFFTSNNLNDNNDNNSHTVSEKKYSLNKIEIDGIDIEENKTPPKQSQVKGKNNKKISIKSCLKIISNDKKEKREEQRKIENEKFQDFFKLQCQECNIVEKFNTFDSLRLHYLQAHNNKHGYVLCCSKKLFNHRELIEHIEWHTNPDKFKCTICHKMYRDQIRLKTHMNLHEPKNGKVYICDICGKSYSIRHHFIQHFRSVHFTEKKFKCPDPQCGKSFVQNSILRTHIRNIHQNANVTVCDICAKVYRSKYHCQIHRLAEHGPESTRPSRLECHQCGASLKNKNSLRIHIARSHEGKTQSCSQCGHIFKCIQALKKHIKNIHTDKPIHKCLFCEKSFKRTTLLQEHITSHTGEVNIYNSNEWLHYQQINYTSKLNIN